jgi:hypothetical protein
MKYRAILTFTAIVSSILGALVVYLMLSVPNDLRADSLLKNARAEMTKGNDDVARKSLTQIVQQYPRTDAAAAATVALLTLAQKDRDELSRAIGTLRRQNESQAKIVAELQKSVGDARSTAAAAAAEAKTASMTAQEASAAAKKKVTPPKPTPKKKTTTKKTTRRRR